MVPEVPEFKGKVEFTIKKDVPKTHPSTNILEHLLCDNNDDADISDNQSNPNRSQHQVQTESKYK